jgi:fatty acid desaturase
MTTNISVDAYEAAERDLLLARARKAWRRHAVTFAVAVGFIAFVELRWGGVSWLVYFLVGAWAVAVGVHYRGWVRHGDERIRDQQGRIEWRAGRANEYLAQRR